MPKSVSAAIYNLNPPIRYLNFRAARLHLEAQSNFEMNIGEAEFVKMQLSNELSDASDKGSLQVGSAITRFCAQKWRRGEDAFMNRQADEWECHLKQGILDSTKLRFNEDFKLLIEYRPAT